ncbi:MAG: hypothetical protein AAFV86_04690 [Pseudomonadota bacterium]
MTGATPAWDAEAARAETEASVATLAAEAGIAIGTPVTLDLRFAPGPAADRDGFLAAMKAAGYSGNTYSDGQREDIEAVLPAIPLDPAAVWAEEARAAAIALAHGYDPQGWGFEAPL